ncbi:hypothetical protein FG05_35063 [Fusarium graminearum]|nr:hypothetical protein FG05_35063 [Fusarium graminearum]
MPQDTLTRLISSYITYYKAKLKDLI